MFLFAIFARNITIAKHESGSVPFEFSSWTGWIHRGPCVVPFQSLSLLLSTCGCTNKHVSHSSEHRRHPRIIIGQEKRTYTHSQCAMRHHRHVVARDNDCVSSRSRSRSTRKANRKPTRASHGRGGWNLVNRWRCIFLLGDTRGDTPENRTRIAREWRRPIASSSSRQIRSGYFSSPDEDQLAVHPHRLFRDPHQRKFPARWCASDDFFCLFIDSFCLIRTCMFRTYLLFSYNENFVKNVRESFNQRKRDALIRTIKKGN